MSLNKLSLKEIVKLVLFSFSWLFLGYWLISQFLVFADSWIPVLFLLLPYLIIVSKVWGVAIKAGTSGVEVSPITEKVSKVETSKTIADKLRSEVTSEREELIQLLTKNEFERLSEENWRMIKGIAKYIAVYTKSPISRVLLISEATNYKYFPVINDDERMELIGLVTYSQVLDYKMRNENWKDLRIENMLARKKPATRVYINESTKEALKRMLKNNLTKLPVVDARNRLKGVITLKDLSEVVR